MELPTAEKNGKAVVEKRCVHFPSRPLALTAAYGLGAVGVIAIAGAAFMVLYSPLAPAPACSDNMQPQLTKTVGDWWLYAAKSNKWEGERLVRLVLAEIDADNYLIGATSQQDAVLHGVLGHLPWLGRVARTDGAAYENGDQQHLNPLGLEIGSPLAFSLFSTQWSGNVTAVGDDNTATVSATSSVGEVLQYTYSSSRGAGILPVDLTVNSAADTNLQLQLNLVSQGSGHRGDVWFARARDLLLKKWIWSTDDGVDSAQFETGQHPRDGAWDMLAVWLRAEHPTQDKATIDFQLTEPGAEGSAVALSHVFTGVHPMATPSLLMPPLAPEYSLKAEHHGGSGGLEVHVAGLIMKQWTL